MYGKRAWKNVKISPLLRLHISDAKPIIADMLEDTSLRSFSCHAEESPEHPYVFFTTQTSPSFSNIRLQASNFEENIEIFKIVKFPLFRKRSKTGEWHKTYFNYSIYDISFLNREFLKTNWCIFQSAASCPKTVPPLTNHVKTFCATRHKRVTRNALLSS